MMVALDGLSSREAALTPLASGVLGFVGSLRAVSLLSATCRDITNSVHKVLASY